MSRAPTGTLDWTSDPPYVRLTIAGCRKAFRLSTSDPQEATRRRKELAEIVQRLSDAGKPQYAEALCKQAARGDEQTRADVREIVDGLIVGQERPVMTSALVPNRGSNGGVTFKDVGDLWTSGELAKKFRRRIKEIDHTENIGRLARYVYPVELDGRTIAETPMRDFAVDHADHVLAKMVRDSPSAEHRFDHGA